MAFFTQVMAVFSLQTFSPKSNLSKTKYIFNWLANWLFSKVSARASANMLNCDVVDDRRVKFITFLESSHTRLSNGVRILKIAAVCWEIIGSIRPPPLQKICVGCQYPTGCRLSVRPRGSNLVTIALLPTQAWAASASMYCHIYPNLSKIYHQKGLDAGNPAVVTQCQNCVM